MTTVAIIQARMGSTRLPGKVLEEISGRTMLYWVVSRTRSAASMDTVVVATTNLRADDAIVAECSAMKVPVFRGSEDDVLDRYHRAAAAFRADPVVRITSDCPLIDPDVIDRVVAAFAGNHADYASNTLTRGYPRGLDVEVFSKAALDSAWREARQDHERVHVTPFIYGNPDRFALHSVECESDHSDLRWTVDTAEDLDVVRRITEALGGRLDFGWRDALELVRRKPQLAEFNRSIRQKDLEEG
jgi:spore coat polysaccharide biosynthesis protein SpsF